jgi:hypothetical protein
MAHGELSTFPAGDAIFIDSLKKNPQAVSKVDLGPAMGCLTSSHWCRFLKLR